MSNEKWEEDLRNEQELVQQFVAATRMSLALRYKLAEGKEDWYGDAASEIRYRLFEAATEEAVRALFWAQYHSARADLCAEHLAAAGGPVSPVWVAACQRELAHTLFEEPWTPEDTFL